MSAEIIQFDDFELDLGRYELRRGDRVIKLEKTPMELLILLVENQGRLVTREEIIQRLWGDNVFVDTRHGINTAVHKLRSALRDDSEQPRILETVVGKGYRLVAMVVARPLGQPSPDVTTLIPETPANGSRNTPESPAVELSGKKRPVRLWVSGVALTALALAFWLMPRNLRDRILGRQSGRSSIQSLAVLPFDNLSGDPSKDYFADGFTDELITDLAERTKIRVVSRSSVMRYKGSRKSLPEIAKELKVEAIVEGSVSLSDQQVRITAQLIQASSDRHLWAHSYEKDRKNLFSIQSEVAATIASLIGAQANGQISATATLGRRFTPETYQLYLECRTLMWAGSEEGMKQAIQCYQQILKLDSTCASAYAGIADSYAAMGELENASKGRVAAIKAVELDSSLPEAHVALGRIKMLYEKDLAGAEAEINRGLALNPSDAGAYMTQALLLTARGRAADAIAAAKTARELDPFSARNATISGMVLFMAGQYDQTIEEEQAALQLDPQHQRAIYWLGYAYEQKAMYKKAIAEYERVLPSDDHGIFLAALGRTLALAGDSKKAAEVKRMIEHFPAGDFVWPYDLALFYTALGEKDRAFQALEKDQKEGGSWFFVLNVDPRLAPLRSDPRYADLLRRIGLPQ